LDLLKGHGTPLARQVFTWRDMVRTPISKLNDDAFTRVRIILMNGIEQEANRFSHAVARFDAHLRVPLAQVRRVEQHQQTLVNWLLGADHSPLETTIGHEQVAIEITAALAQQEPDAYLAQAYRFGLLEDFDHLYRFGALQDRMAGADVNNILQSYTDVMPGRPTEVEHRAAEDDVRRPYDRRSASPITKLNALTLVAAENQVRDYYMTIGPQFADPVARQLYAEIASIEEQHVTHYESLTDPTESALEKWVLHEATEVYNYYSCVEAETNPRLKAIWERFLDYELGHLAVAIEMFKAGAGRDPAEILPESLPPPIPYASQRDFLRRTLRTEVGLRANGPDFVAEDRESEASLAYRAQINREGSPSTIVASGYVFNPGTELAPRRSASGATASPTHAPSSTAHEGAQP
jgi:hypothetical protein